MHLTVNLGPLLLTLAFVLSPWEAAAQNYPGSPGIGILRGSCLKLIAAGKAGRCNGEVASVTLDDRPVTLIFSSSAKQVGFRGNGQAIKPLSNGAPFCRCSLSW